MTDPPIDPEPPEPEPPSYRTGRRRYDRVFDWAYDPRNLPPRAEGPGLIGIVWDGLPLNTDDPGIVENLEGWDSSPPLEGNNAARTISDGAAWGPKTLGPRVLVVHGAAVGPRDQLDWFRDQLTARAAGRRPAELSVTVGQRTLVAEVRADAEQYRQTALGSEGFRYQVTLVAADPLLYEGSWQVAGLTTGGGLDTGRDYPREYTWQYASPFLLNSARLPNRGNHSAPVFALYEGELSESRLISDQGGIIRLAPLGAGMQVRVSTATLTAEAAGGLSRASFVLAGSRPMELDPGVAARWSLYAAGAGTVLLTWRSAWA